MDTSILGIERLDIYAVLGILVFFGLMEVVSGYLHRSKRTRNDWIQELVAFFGLSVLTKPAIVFTVVLLGDMLFPSFQYVFAEWSIWISLPVYLLIDDMLQYWYHRSAHEYEWLWKLHRPHHQAEEMGFFVSYRNAALYYIIMPNIWWIAIFSFLGGGKAVAIGIILKQLVIIGSHSPTKWDQYLYKFTFLNPITSLIERIIVTPAFHFSHHGKSMVDGVSDPNGNYGNMLSIWDQLFGTATFTRQFPTELGLVNDPKEKWTASYLYPLVKSGKPESELAKNFKKLDTSQPEPLTIELEAGKKYLWCKCGKSGNQPFCDGTHHGSKYKPVLFELKKSKKVRLCNCKLTKAGPFCDNSHLILLNKGPDQANG